MSAWLAALPAVLVAAVLLTVPGAVLARLAGLRGIPAWGAAAPLSVTLTSVVAVLAALLGLPWGAPVVLAGLVVAAAAAAVLGRYARPVPSQDPGRVRLWAVAGLAGGGVAAALAVARGVRSPEAIPQTYDAVFHLNAVGRVLSGGDASSLDLGAMTTPTAGKGFYPAAWHGVTSLVAHLSGASIPVSANAVAVAIAAVVWPAGCVLLVRQALGPAVPGLVAAGLLSAGFTAFPFTLLSYGTLWPNALGTALLPATLALLATAAGLARQDRIGRLRAGLVAGAALPGLALAHPNTVVALMVLTPVLAIAAVRRWAVQERRPSRTRVLLVTGAIVVAVLVDLWVIALSPVFAVTRGTDWPAWESAAQALGEVSLVAPSHAPVALVPAALAVVGLVVALRSRLWWLGVCHLLLAGLYLLAVSSDGPISQALTGPWYNDAFRLGAMLPVTGLPLAVLGLGPVWAAVSRAPWWRAAVRRRSWVQPVALTACLLALVALAVRADARRIGTWYYSRDQLVGAGERDLLQRLDSLVPAGTVVAGSPWNGSALGQALSHRVALFPHLAGTWGPDRTLLADSMADATSNPDVCRAARRLHVGYVLDGPSTFWLTDARQHLYDGLQVAGRPGFVPVARGGRLTLYRVTACGTV